MLATNNGKSNKILMWANGLLFGALIAGLGSWLAFGQAAASSEDVKRVEEKLAALTTQVAVINAKLSMHNITVETRPGRDSHASD